MTRNIHNDLSRRPVQPAQGIWVYDAGGGINISSGFVDITMDTEGYKDSGWFTFTATNATITIVNDGIYEVHYYIGTQVSSGTGRSISAGRLVVDTGGGFNEIGGTRGPMYNRTANVGYGAASLSILYSLSAGDIIKLQGDRISGSDTIVTLANACGITIKTFKPS